MSVPSKSKNPATPPFFSSASFTSSTSFRSFTSPPAPRFLHPGSDCGTPSSLRRPAPGLRQCISTPQPEPPAPPTAKTHPSPPPPHPPPPHPSRPPPPPPTPPPPPP